MLREVPTAAEAHLHNIPTTLSHAYDAKDRANEAAVGDLNKSPTPFGIHAERRRSFDHIVPTPLGTLKQPRT